MRKQMLCFVCRIDLTNKDHHIISKDNLILKDSVTTERLLQPDIIHYCEAHKGEIHVYPEGDGWRVQEL